MGRDYRIRDPVHGLITFRAGSKLDQLAWALLDTPEFQRLRRVRQLGVSEFVFPSATHTRFAHCIGVFHTARMLVEIVDRELPIVGQRPDQQRADTAVIAALLHDLGHGPFSHTFEGVQARRGLSKKHERWSAEIVLNPNGQIAPLLQAYRLGLADEIAALLEAEDPTDIYHAVVSSSFDADRLDYLRRDRLMTGTQAGAIDFDWLTEHIRVGEVVTEAADEDKDDPPRTPTFCLDRKALPAAEQFLLARYTLHEQVYFHKTTRCVEYMISRLLGRAALLASKTNAADITGLPGDHPLLSFLGTKAATVSDYLALDDVLVTGAMDLMQRAKDVLIRDLAIRLRNRDLYKTLDIRVFGHDPGKQRQRVRQIDRMFPEGLADGSVWKDDGAGIGIYTQIGGDDDKTHKKMHILDANKPREISEISPMVQAMSQKQLMTRYYFERDEDRQRARQIK